MSRPPQAVRQPSRHGIGQCSARRPCEESDIAIPPQRLETFPKQVVSAPRNAENIRCRLWRERGFRLVEQSFSSPMDRSNASGALRNGVRKLLTPADLLLGRHRAWQGRFDGPKPSSMRQAGPARAVDAA